MERIEPRQAKIPGPPAADSERKFVGGMELEGFASAWLGHACLKDSAFPEGTVSSVYYDTPALDLYGEKANGDFQKTKCRLRWYDPDVAPDPRRRAAFLEIKRRTGERRGKARMRIDLERDWLDSADLDDPGFQDLLARCSPALEPSLPLNLAASAVIRYHRHRFVCPFTMGRVCLDTSISLGRTNRSLLPHLGHVVIPSAVIEIKGDAGADIPWLGALYKAGFRKRSFSKYGACMGRLLGKD